MKTLYFNNLTIEQVKLLNSIGDAIKEDFNSLTNQILLSSARGLPWLLHPVTNRNPYQSDFFLNICYVLLARELIKEGFDKIVTKNKLQKKVLSKYIKENKIVCDVEVDKNKVSLIKKYERLISLAKVLIRVLLYLSTKNKKRTREILSKSNIILVDTFILKNSITNGKYIDRYYSGLQDYVDESYKTRIFWLPTILSTFNRKQLNSIWRNSKEKIIYKHDFLKLSSYLSIAYNLMRANISKKSKFEIRNFDVSPFVFKELKVKKFSNSTFEGLVNYKFIKRLKKAGVSVDLVVDWNENQPIDKGLVKGVHDFYPKTIVKGYQGYIISTDFNFYIQPTDFEIENGVIPDEICVVGDGLKERIKKFTNKIHVETAPAFRFQGVFINYEKISDGTKKILVALPIGVNESYDILTIVSKALILLEKENYFQLLIKPHPVLNVDKLKKAMGSMWNKDFQMVNGDFNELVSQMDLLIGSTSTTLLETLTRGIPVIVIGSQNGITQNPIPKTIDKRIWRLCYTKEEVGKEMKYFLNITDQRKEQFNKIGKMIRANYFEPVTKESVSKFLNIE